MAVYISFGLLQQLRSSFCSGTDGSLSVSLLILFFLLLGRPLQNSPRLGRFKLDRDEIRQECSSSKYASTDAVGFLTRRHNLKMAAMTSFHTGKCCAATYSEWKRNVCRVQRPSVPDV